MRAKSWMNSVVQASLLMAPISKTPYSRALEARMVILVLLHSAVLAVLTAAQATMISAVKYCWDFMLNKPYRTLPSIN